MWDHLNEEKVRKLWTRRRREDFTVTFNEDPTEAGNSPWQSGHSCQASGRRRRVLGTTGDLYSGSPSRIYNHSWNGLIVRDGTSLSISSASHPRLLCAEIALRSFVVTFYSSIGDPKFNFPLCSKTAVVNTQGPRNLIIMEGKAFFFFFLNILARRTINNDTQGRCLVDNPAGRVFTFFKTCCLCVFVSPLLEQNASAAFRVNRSATIELCLTI